jgi:hypothetical protein
MSSLDNVLEELDDSKISKKVNQFLHKFHIRINALNGLEKSERIFFMDLQLVHARGEINSNIDSKVKSHLKNEITAIYRNKIRLINGTKI